MIEKSNADNRDSSSSENGIVSHFSEIPSLMNIPTKPKGFLQRIFFRDRVSYEEYFASQLRARHMDLDGDFRILMILYSTNNYSENDLKDIKPIAAYISDLLDVMNTLLSKGKLEKVDLLSGSSYLDQVEQCLIWITPPDIKIAEIKTLRSSLDKLSPATKEAYKSILDDCESEMKGACGFRHQNDNEQGNTGPYNRNFCNSAIEEVIEALNKNTLDEMINTGLQIERLRSLRFWGIVLLISFILLFPIVSRVNTWEPYLETVNYWDLIITGSWFPLVHYLIPLLPYFGAWHVALGFCIIGGIGGFLSGLLQVRSSKTNLGLYEESVLLFQIRPIFGAFAALVIFMLLSWHVLTDVIKGDPGSYVLAAFLSGFSERYFLKLLMPASGETNKEEPPKKEASPEN